MCCFCNNLKIIGNLFSIFRLIYEAKINNKYTMKTRKNKKSIRGIMSLSSEKLNNFELRRLIGGEDPPPVNPPIIPKLPL